MALTVDIAERVEAMQPMMAAVDPSRRSTLGQYMTPASVARYMASLFSVPGSTHLRLLDPGAGLGALAVAFIQRWRQEASAGSALEVTAYEIDSELRKFLGEHLDACQDGDFPAGQRLHTTALPYDFIEAAVHPLEFCTSTGFTHAILNPPYKKISCASPHRHWLREAGIETVNLYSAFVALALELLTDGGELVAIIPRSFCNGPYYRPFREFMLRRAAIEHIHLFESRTQAFKADNVLQENVILKLSRNRPQGSVSVSHCTDGSFGDYRESVFEFAAIVRPDDAERFIRIPTGNVTAPRGPEAARCHSLAEIGLEVSTGPVVDFRLRPFLRAQPAPDTVPLLYPCHVADECLAWPLPASKKANALLLLPETRKWLYPNGFYTVVRRFSAKEEKRRIVARVVRPDAFESTSWIGFENHLNVFHQHKQGIPEDLAFGLAAYLNSTGVDEHFRLFNGHTQVNATDLRSLRYPSREVLMELGAWTRQAGRLSQELIDEHLERLA